MKPKSTRKAKPKTIDEYLAALSNDKRAALERLRRIVRAVAPRAEECISYGLPTFRLDGRGIACFGAAANHCAFYGAVGAHTDELEAYDTSKGTIRFQPTNPLPVALVRKLVKARIAKNAAR
jgi:uncharacterized protein YdhG (YjbR/CyaY superfamily)